MSTSNRPVLTRKILKTSREVAIFLQGTDLPDTSPVTNSANAEKSNMHCS